MFRVCFFYKYFVGINSVGRLLSQYKCLFQFSSEAWFKQFYLINNYNMLSEHIIEAQELEVRSLYHLYSLKTKSSRCHFIVMTRSETKLSVAIPAPVSGQSAVNLATATSKCSITFFYLMIKVGMLRQNRTLSQIYFKPI